MYYLRARLYRVQLGRFLTQDGEFGNLQEPLSLHKYLYASADPVSRVDPSGRANFFGKVITAAPILVALGPEVVRELPEEEEAAIAITEYCIPRAGYLFRFLDPIAQPYRPLPAPYLTLAPAPSLSLVPFSPT